VKANSLVLKLRKSEFLPELAAFYQYQKEFNDKALSFTPPHTIGLQLNIPIFGSGQKLAKVSQAKIELLKAQNTREQMSNTLRLDYYSSKSTLLNAYDKYNTESVNMKLARKIYDRALVKYTNGVISSTDLTQIQNQYLTAQSSYYQSLQDLIAAKSKLQKVLTNSN
jgi:outer membrane protein TolC